MTAVTHRLPDAPARYDATAEAQFRHAVQNALSFIASEIAPAPAFEEAAADVDFEGDLNFRYRLNEPHGLAVAYAWSTTQAPTRPEVLDGTHPNYGVRDAPQGEFEVAPAVAPDADDEVWLTAIPFSRFDEGVGDVAGRPGEEVTFHIRVGTDGGQIRQGTIIADKLTDQAIRFTTDITFSAVDRDTVQWTLGTIQLANSDTFNISAGNTGNMAGITYIFLDRTVSTTELQVTTDFTRVASDDVVLVAVAKPGPTTGQRAFFVPGVGVFGLNADQLSPDSIDQTKIQNGAVSTPQLAANAVAAGNIQAGAVQTEKLAANAVVADKIAGNTITGAEIQGVSLSAIFADLGLVVAGAIENAAGTAGIFIDGSGDLGGYSSLPGAWTRYINLAASAGEPFIKHPAFEIRADGSATFSGDLEAAGGTFAGKIRAGQLRFEDSSGNLEGYIGTGVGGRMSIGGVSELDLTTASVALRIGPTVRLTSVGGYPWTLLSSAGPLAGYMDVRLDGTACRIPVYDPS